VRRNRERAIEKNQKPVVADPLLIHCDFADPSAMSVENCAHDCAAPPENL